MSNQPGVNPPARAVCLVSGGMDSAVTLAEARAQGLEAFALSFDYGQRHKVELEAAQVVARVGGAVEHRVVRLDLSALGGSALTGAIDVPKGPGPEQPKGHGPEQIARAVPVTYVPARNTVFLSVALGWAEILGARDIYIGITAVDYSGYPDCRPEFVTAFEQLARVATAAGAEEGASFRVRAPLIELSKAEIVLRAEELGVDLSLTHTCYDPVPSAQGATLACGACDACRLRLAGFAAAGRSDGIAYAPGS